MTPSETHKQQMLEGYRRAHQWLRAAELGDDQALAALRVNFVGPGAYVWVNAAVTALICNLLGRLGDAADPTLRSTHEALVRQAADPPASVDWPAVAEQAIDVALSLTAQWLPKQEWRLKLYEHSARAGYEIADEVGRARWKRTFNE